VRERDVTTLPAHPAPARHVVPKWRLWFGLFGGPAAWSLQEIADYALNAHSCFPRDVPLADPTFDPVRVVTAVVVVVALGVAAASLWVAYQAWRSTRNGAGRDDHHVLEVGEGRARFMAFSGVLLSSIFAFAVLMNGIPIATLPPCAG